MLPAQATFDSAIDIMRIKTYEGMIENGQVRLTEDAYIPDNTKVYVIVPAGDFGGRVRLASPSLAHADQAAAFTKEVEEEPSDAPM